MKKTEFSKIIMVSAGFINLAVILFSCVMIWRTNDLTPLAYLIPSVGAEVASATASYYNKAKLENKIKLMAKHGIAVTEQTISTYV